MHRKPLDPMRGSKGRCPACASTRVVTAPAPPELGEFHARELTVCANCKAVWEPLDPGLIWNPSDPHCSFREPCDNCAFRPGSPEQADVPEWTKLIASLRAGASFHCHKGVPIDPSSEDGFKYPHDKAGKPKRDKLRICRGYLEAWGKWIAKDFGKEGKADG